jgi:hypothetical protein
MDPYLEGYVWPDVHNRLAAQITRQLQPLIRPHYVARLEVYTVSDRVPAHEVGIFFPDVEVVRVLRESAVEAQATSSPSAAIVTPAPASAPVAIPLEVRLTSIHIRDVDVHGNELITAIELLSPANKREPGLTAYSQKRDELIKAGVNLLEIDLIRRGIRPWLAEGWPVSPYMIALTRARHARAEVWPLTMHEPLPILPVPLRAPDPDAPLDLPTALITIYDEADYTLSLDYAAPPPEPALSEDEAQWLDEVLRKAGWRK